MFPHTDKNIVPGTMPDILLSSNDFIEIINKFSRNCETELHLGFAFLRDED